MFIIITLINDNKHNINMYLNQEDKEDKEVILEAYQALSNECNNHSFFIKSLINELLTNKKNNKLCYEQSIINDTDIDLYLILGIQNVSIDELFKPRNHLIKLLKKQFDNEKNSEIINYRIMSSIIGNMTPFLINTTSLETKCKLSSILENHSTILKHNLNNHKEINMKKEKFAKTVVKDDEYGELIIELKDKYDTIIDIFNDNINTNYKNVKNEINTYVLEFNNINRTKLLESSTITEAEINSVSDNIELLEKYQIEVDSFLNTMFEELGIPEEIVEELSNDEQSMNNTTDNINDSIENLNTYSGFLDNSIDWINTNNNDIRVLKYHNDSIKNIKDSTDFKSSYQTIIAFNNDLKQAQEQAQAQTIIVFNNDLKQVQEQEQVQEQVQEQNEKKLKLHHIIIISICSLILIIIIIFISKYVLKNNKNKPNVMKPNIKM